jgi:hypothetical protein
MKFACTTPVWTKINFVVGCFIIKLLVHMKPSKRYTILGIEIGDILLQFQVVLKIYP